MRSIQKQIDTLAQQAQHALLAERITAKREIRRIRNALRKGKPEAQLRSRCQHLAECTAASKAIRDYRRQHRPHLEFDPALPITSQKEQLLAAIQQHPVIIVSGETGSGKTTQLPKICLAAGRGIDGHIGVTQPRRIAAISVCRRMAEEMNENPGQTVGHKIRFQDTIGDYTRIKVMTDGILLNEAHHDPFLNQYDTLIVDEAHERSLNIDFILGIVKKLIDQRKDLKLIITSATIDTQKFAQAFGQAPILEVSGRTYPVSTHYLPPETNKSEELTHIENAARAMDQLHRKYPRGDVLIFMPTEQDIRDTCDIITGQRYPATQVIPLFARLSAAEQQKVFCSSNQRKIIVATNVAETSITIPGIRYVIDTGLARISQYTPRSRTTTLPVVPISQSSADQRQGRCGRVANGVCIRLYSEEDYQSRPQFTLPEILRANLAEVILRMIALRLGAVEAFPFIDRPAAKSIQDGYRLLLELDAIEPLLATKADAAKKKQQIPYALTAKGRIMARLPLDPRLARMLIEAHERSCLNDVAIIAAVLSIQDPRERPVEKQALADAAHAQFNNPASDFVTYLHIWHAYQQIVKHRRSWREVKKFCSDNFLSFRRMREWQDIHRQILSVLAEHRIRSKAPSQPPPKDISLDHSWYAAVHRSILSGFLANIAMKKEKQIFQAAHQRQAMIFPGSVLFKNPGNWIVAAEMVHTSRLFARCAAAIDPAWLEPAGKRQCKYTHLDPHWSRRSEQVVVTEQVSLYGLIIDRRMRAYGPINTHKATDIFIQSALINGDVRQPLSFMQHNRRLIEEIQDMENRLRCKDLLVDEQDLFQFYRQRLEAVYDLRTLKKHIRKAGNDRFLRLRKDDLLVREPDRDQLAHYPHRIQAGAQQFECHYHFAPGKKEDGITVQVDTQSAPIVKAEAFQWLVPGLLTEKITALIKALPKHLRKQLVPVADTAAIIGAEMPKQPHTSLANALSRFICNRFGVDIPASAWNEENLPDHLRMRIAITDTKGRIQKSSRNPSILQTSEQATALPDELQTMIKEWECSNILEWRFGDLPNTIVLGKSKNRQYTLYPALEKRGDKVALTAFTDPSQAAQTHPQGVKALMMKQFDADIKFLRKNLQLSVDWDSPAHYFGGRKTLSAQLIDSVLDSLMAKDIRTAETFAAHVRKIRQRNLAAQGQDKRRAMLNVLSAYQQTRLALDGLKKTHTANTQAQAFLTDLDKTLQDLVPQNFVALYDNQHLNHLVRYLKALTLRAERGVVNPAKDRIKADQIEPFTRRLETLVQQLTPQSSQEKRKAVENFFWMLQEFKISIFAQEIKTAQPVSAKRLNAQLKAIEQMV